ncbi:hypothetical protein DL98DRAFT_590109 [Cadophora sp. DSE1049]|nr:hypothetical protein DL98DRAFT_590109 [Cadophora sp. DSE1049]
MTKPAMGFYNLPYDVRVSLWQKTYQDESRVVLADASLRKGTISTAPGCREDESFTFVEDFFVSIVPTRETTVTLAMVFFAPEIKQFPDFLKNLFKTRLASNIFVKSESILFVPNVLTFTEPLRKETETRFRYFSEATALVRQQRSPKNWDIWLQASEQSKSAPTVSSVYQGNIEAIAITPWTSFEVTRDVNESSNTIDYFIRAVSALPHLKTLYLVTEIDESTGVTRLGSAHFTNFVWRTKMVCSGTGTESETKKLLNATDAAHYQNASSTRRSIERKWTRSSSPAPKGPCPEIKIVSWARSIEKETRKRKRDDNSDG